MIYYVIDDPFKIINDYEEFYTNQSRELFINRDHVSTRLYIKNYPLYHYDSFIFGSSRSYAFLAKEWQKYILSPAFHFDASGESLFGIYTKIKYLYLNKRPLKNCLIIINAGLLSKTFNNEETALIKDPEISGESRLKYHYKFFTAFLTGGFFVPYFAWKAGSINRLFLDYPPVQKKWFVHYRLCN